MNIIDNLTQKYSSEEGYVFKSCSTDWIVVLQKLPDTKTNESRSGIKDSMYAKVRANKLLVVDIVHKLTGQITNEIVNSVHSDKIITYKTNEVIEASDFDNNLDEICSTGIHYFKSVESAFYYETPDDYRGQHKCWYDNGNLIGTCWVVNGKSDGPCTTWYKNGQLHRKYTFKNGILDGPFKEWYGSGQQNVEGMMKNNKQNGLWKVWHENGQLKEECSFNTGLVEGLYKCWDENGQLLSCTTQVNPNANNRINSIDYSRYY
jgi:antitoxin component YwqK of YwqJK toxin-antitoxin module